MGVAIKTKPGTGTKSVGLDKRNMFVRKATGEPEVVHISAKEGEPSTFWKSASGHYYRTKAEAYKDNTSKAVDPEKYRINTSFLVKYKSWILAGCVAALLTAALWYFAPKIAGKFKK